MPNEKSVHFSLRNDTIECVCGEEIVLTPDVKAMDNSIENHVAIHMQKSGDPENLSEAERLRDFLIAQVFFRIASPSEKGGSNSDIFNLSQKQREPKHE